MKNIIIAIVIVALIGIGAFLLGRQSTETIEVADQTSTQEEQTASTTEEMMDENPGETVIGQSVEGKDIVAYHFGTGDEELLFIGGIHGGYSWNTALVAYDLIEYMKETEADLAENIKVTVIPVMNPDGLEEVVGTTGSFDAEDVDATESERIAGRFNANDVDLNRNFDCQWSSTSKWQDRTVSGGSRVFSEPEARAIRQYVQDNDIAGAVVWYSSAGGVFASSCSDAVSEDTIALTNAFADAANYKAYEEFDFYEITGDMVNWFAKENIPAISVLLTDHESVEWSKNQAGVTAFIEYFAN